VGLASCPAAGTPRLSGRPALRPSRTPKRPPTLSGDGRWAGRRSLDMRPWREPTSATGAVPSPGSSC